MFDNVAYFRRINTVSKLCRREYTPTAFIDCSIVGCSGSGLNMNVRDVCPDQHVDGHDGGLTDKDGVDDYWQGNPTQLYVCTLTTHNSRRSTRSNARARLQVEVHVVCPDL